MTEHRVQDKVYVFSLQLILPMDTSAPAMSVILVSTVKKVNNKYRLRMILVFSFITILMKKLLKYSFRKTYYFTGPCDGTPCTGHGTCNIDPTDAIDGRSCSCNPGYTGDKCEISNALKLLLQD